MPFIFSQAGLVIKKQHGGGAGLVQSWASLGVDVVFFIDMVLQFFTMHLSSSWINIRTYDVLCLPFPMATFVYFSWHQLLSLCAEFIYIYIHIGWPELAMIIQGLSLFEGFSCWEFQKSWFSRRFNHPAGMLISFCFQGHHVPFVYIHVWTVELWDGQWLSAMFLDDWHSGGVGSFFVWQKCFGVELSTQWCTWIPSGHWLLPFDIPHQSMIKAFLVQIELRVFFFSVTVFFTSRFLRPFDTDPGKKHVQKIAHLRHVTALFGRYAKTTPRGMEWETDLKKIWTLERRFFRWQRWWWWKPNQK